MNNIYVGSRYVAKFFDDGNGGSQWRSNVEFESMIIVINQGNSYISKQHVPIGIDINNTTYWIKTFDYNAQVETYRQDTINYKNEVNSNINTLTEDNNTFKNDISDNLNNIQSNVNDNLNAITSQEYYKLSDKLYNGFNMYLPFSSQFGTYQNVIDNAVRLKAKCINICVRFSMATLNSEVITTDTQPSDLINVVNYAKLKGLKVHIKPHMNHSSWEIYSNVTTITNWINSYSQQFLQLITWVKDSIDIVSITNELNYQTSTNLALWTTLINNIRALNSNIKLTNANKMMEINTNVFLQLLDYIGCNLYIGIDGDLTTNHDILSRNMYHNYSDNINYIDILLEKSIALNKKILITEVGILAILDSLKNPAKSDYDSTYFNNNINLSVQTLYYDIFLNLLMNASVVEGVMIWSLTDGFSPVYNTECENLIIKYFGGVQNA